MHTILRISSFAYTLTFYARDNGSRRTMPRTTRCIVVLHKITTIFAITIIYIYTYTVNRGWNYGETRCCASWENKRFVSCARETGVSWCFSLYAIHGIQFYHPHGILRRSWFPYPWDLHFGININPSLAHENKNQLRNA